MTFLPASKARSETVENNMCERGRRKIINQFSKRILQILLLTDHYWNWLLQKCHSGPCLNRIGTYSEVLKWFWPQNQTFSDQRTGAYHKGKKETNTAQLSSQARWVPKCVQTSTVGSISSFFLFPGISLYWFCLWEVILNIQNVALYASRPHTEWPIGKIFPVLQVKLRSAIQLT